MSVARRLLPGFLVAVLLTGLGMAVTAAPAAAAPGPWTWTKVSTVGHGDGQGNWVTTTCPSGYRVVDGGWDYAGTISSAQVVGGNAFRVQAFVTLPLTVTAWCARSDQVDLQITDRTLQTSQDAGGGYSRGLGDFACDGDRTPVGASFTWTSPGDAYSAHVLQSGPETIGGTNEWFVTATAPRSASVLDVKLQCVANADLVDAAWYQVAGATGSSDQVTASCPAQQRFVTGGEHIDSVLGNVHTSTSVDIGSWTTKADVPSGDTLTVSVLCVPAGDPVATITSGPPRNSNSTSAFFAFDSVDPAGSTAHTYCFLNTSGLGPCDGGYAVDDLTEGQNVFSIEAYTDDGRGWASTEKDYYFWVDLTAPTVALSPPPLFSLGSRVALNAVGSDNQAVDHEIYTITSRPSSGSDASSATPVMKRTTTTTGRLNLAVKPGMSYRVSVKAVDAATNVSTPKTRYTAVPVDNLALTDSTGWKLIKSTVYTNNLVSRTTTQGATLAGTMFGTTLGVVATTCATCGSVGVYVGSHLVTTLNLHAAATHYQVVFPVQVGTANATMKVTLKVVSSGKTVEIDGLGAVAS